MIRFSVNGIGFLLELYWEDKGKPRHTKGSRMDHPRRHIGSVTDPTRIHIGF